MEKFEFKNYEDGKEMLLLEDYTLKNLPEIVADHIEYTIRHKKALIMTYMELSGLVPSEKSRLWLHDMEKLWLYYNMQDCQKAHEIHVTYNSHHYPNWKSEDDKREAVLDYECARITKPDKPRNALETIRVFRPETEEQLRPFLIEWNINSEERKEFEFNLYKQNRDYVETRLYDAMRYWMGVMPMCSNRQIVDFETVAKDFTRKIADMSIF